MRIHQAFSLLLSALTVTTLVCNPLDAFALDSARPPTPNCRGDRDNGKIKVSSQLFEYTKEVCLCGEWRTEQRIVTDQLCGKSSIIMSQETTWKLYKVRRGKYGSECKAFPTQTRIIENYEERVCSSSQVKPPATPNERPTPAPVSTPSTEDGICAIGSDERFSTFAIRWYQRPDGTWDPILRLLSSKGVRITPVGTPEPNGMCQVEYIEEDLKDVAEDEGEGWA